MNEFTMTGFEFSRPEYFWTLLLIVPALIAYWRFSANQKKWSGFIDKAFLTALSGHDTTQTHRQRWFAPALISLILVLMVIALSGPSIKRPVPPTTSEDALVIIMDLSLSMLAEDIKPSRYQRVKFKLEDLLSQRTTGHTGLVVYSGDAHLVSPLTEDTRTIKHLVKSLDPWMIPSKGSRLYRAVEEAQQLLDHYPGSNARILLFTDEISAHQYDKTKQLLKYPMFVVGVGSEEGAPIKLPDGRLLKQPNSQNIVVAQFDNTLPTRLAQDSGASYDALSVSDRDILPALNFQKYQMKEHTSKDLSDILSKQDIGFALLPLLLLLALPLFRKGLFFSSPWLAPMALSLALLSSMGDQSSAYAAPESAVHNNINNGINNAVDGSAHESSQSHPTAATGNTSDWRNFFRNQQQKAQHAYDQGDYHRAAELFEAPLRKGNAYSKAQAYEQAEHQYQQAPQVEAKYNLANIQAQQGKLDEAKASYQNALAQAQAENRQDLVDRIHRDLKIIEQQQEQQQEEQQQQQQNQPSGEPDDSNEGSEQSSDSQNQNSPSSDQSDEGQQQNDASGEHSEAQDSPSDAQASNDPTSDNGSESEDGSSSEEQSPSQESLDRQFGQGTDDDSNHEPDDPDSQHAQSQAAEGQPDTEDPSSDQVFDYGQSSAEATEYTQQELEQAQFDQLMRKIQTDPAQLLKNKFKIQHYQRKQPANEEQVW